MPRASLTLLAECFVSRRARVLSSLLIMKIWQASSGTITLYTSLGFLTPSAEFLHEEPWSQVKMCPDRSSRKKQTLLSAVGSSELSHWAEQWTRIRRLRIGSRFFLLPTGGDENYSNNRPDI